MSAVTNVSNDNNETSDNKNTNVEKKENDQKSDSQIPNNTEAKDEAQNDTKSKEDAPNAESNTNNPLGNIINNITNNLSGENKENAETDVENQENKDTETNENKTEEVQNNEIPDEDKPVLNLTTVTDAIADALVNEPTSGEKGEEEDQSFITEPQTDLRPNTDQEVEQDTNDSNDADYNQNEDPVQQPKTFHETPSGKTSIHTYNRSQPCKFTEKATIEALDQCGIEPSELFLPNNQQLSKYPNDTDIRNLVLQHHNQRIDRLVEMVSDKREEILNMQDKLAMEIEPTENDQKAKEGENEEDFLKYEQRKLDRAQMQHKREVEAILIRALTSEMMEKNQKMRDEREKERQRKINEERQKRNEESHRKHLQRMKELEEIEKKRKEEEEKKRREQYERDKHLLEIQKQKQEERTRQLRKMEKERQEKSEKNRLALMQLEENRKQKINETQKQIEEREKKRLQAKQEEYEKMCKEKQMQREKRDAQLKAALDQQKEQLELKRKKAEEKDKIQIQKHLEYKQKKQEEQTLYINKQKSKIDRNAEIRNQIEKETLERKRKLVKTDSDLNRRLNKILIQREKQAELARTNRTDASIRTQQRFEQYKQNQEKKRIESDNNLRKFEENYQRVKEEKEKQRLMKSIQSSLKQDERDSNAKHLEYLRQRKIRIMRQKQEETDQRITAKQLEKQKLQNERLRAVTKMADERAAFDHEFKQSMKTMKNLPIQQLAQKYDIDLKELKKKVENKRPTTSLASSATQTNQISSTLPNIHNPTVNSYTQYETENDQENQNQEGGELDAIKDTMLPLLQGPNGGENNEDQSKDINNEKQNAEGENNEGQNETTNDQNAESEKDSQKKEVQNEEGEKAKKVTAEVLEAATDKLTPQLLNPEENKNDESNKTETKNDQPNETENKEEEVKNNQSNEVENKEAANKEGEKAEAATAAVLEAATDKLTPQLLNPEENKNDESNKTETKNDQPKETENKEAKSDAAENKQAVTTTKDVLNDATDKLAPQLLVADAKKDEPKQDEKAEQGEAEKAETENKEKVVKDGSEKVVLAAIINDNSNALFGKK